MLHILNHNDEIVDYFDVSDGDIISPDMVRNVETLEDILEFSVISERSLHVQERNRVIIKDNEGEYREFIIMQYESNIDGFTNVSCVGSHLEDFASAKPFKPQRLERYSTNQAISFLSADTGWELAPDNEWNGLKTTSWSSWKDRLSLLKQLQTTYDMRLSFYIELGTNRVKHRYVKLKEVNPMFNGEEIVYGENMIDLKRSVDFTDVATALIALGPEDDDGNRLIIEMKDDEAQEQLGLPYRYLWQIYEPESDDTKMTEARLKTLARTKLNKVKAASVTYTIQSTQLDVKVGDMIRVKNEDFTPELYVEAEIIEIKYNAFNKLCDYKFGILTEYTREEVYERFNKLLETLRTRLANINHNTENIINERFEEELKDLERYIHKSPSAPLNPKEGDLWLDTSHNQVAVLKRYENGQWIKSSVSEAHDINAPTREEVMYQMITERAHRLKNMMLNNFGTFNNLTNQKYYGDLPRDIRESFSASFTEQSKAYTDFERDYDNIHPEQPTIGLIVQAMDSAIRFEEASLNFNDAYAQIRAAYDSYIELLRRQYSDEKYEEALNEIADKFGLEVVDGKLVGDADFIDSMNEIKDDLQKQLDDAKKAFEDLEIGGRNLIPAFTNSRWEIPENGTVIEDYRLKYLANSGHISSSVNIDVEPNSDYTFTFNTENGRWYIYNEDDSILIQGSSSVSANESTTFNTGENESVRLLLNTWSQLISEDRIFWELQLEKGTVATDWTPALEDTDNKITNINQSITNIEGRLESTVNKDTFDLLNKTVTQQGTLLSQTAETLKSKADSSRVDTINDTVTQQGTELSQTAQDLKLKANQKDLDTLNDTVSEQGTKITANAQEIALRAKESDLDTVTGRVDKAEADIEVNAREISSRVKEVDYISERDGIVERLSGAESSITQQSKLIKTKVGSTELTQAIENIELGGENLIPFADLPKDRSHWSTWSSSNNLYTSDNAYPDYMWVNDNDGDADNSLAPQSPLLTEKVIEGQEYTLSFIVTDMRNVYEDMRYCYLINNIQGEPNQFFSDVKRKEIGLETSFIAEGRPMYLYYVTFKSEITANVKVLVGSRKIASGNARFYVKQVKLEKGNKPTGFSLSTKGLEDRIVNHDTQFEQTDKQLALRATMTDVNKSDETLSRAISELVIDSANGLKFNYDSNGRLESYSVGRDGIQFDGSKIRFTASDSIMLKIADAQKAGSDAKSKIDNLDVGSENLLPDSGWHKEPAGTYVIPDNWSRAVGGIVWGGRQSENWLLARVNHDADGTRGSTTASYYGLRSPQILEPLIAGQEYTFTFKTRNVSGNNMNYRYTYIIYDESSNQKISPVFIKNADNGGQLWSVTFTASSSDTGHILIGHSIPKGSSNAFYLKEPMLYKGNAISSWADSIQNKTDKDKIVASINLDDTGAQISGKKIELNGDVDMLNGNTRIKNLNLNHAVITGGDSTNNIKLDNKSIISYGKFSRTWAGITDTANLELGLYDGQIRIRNLDDGYNLYLTEKGLSTTMAGATAGYSAGTLEFHSQRFNEVSRGVTLHSTFGTVALLSDESTIVTRSRLTNNIESEDYSVYVRPFMKTRPGTNEFQFYVKDNSSGLATDGAILFGSLSQGSGYGSGIRFKKDNRDRATVYATNLNGDIGTGDFDADQFWGTGFGSKSTNLYAMASGELRVTDTRGYNNGNPVYSEIRAKKIHTTSNYAFENHGPSNTYFGVGTAEMRITDNNHYNGGKTGYRDIRFANWRAMSHEKYKYDIKEWNLSVLPIFTEELQLHTFKLETERDTEKDLIHQGIILRENSNDDRFPSEWREGDGFNGNKVMWWTVKGVQELAQENYKKDKIIKEQGAKIEELQKQMSEVMALLNKE